MTLSINSLWDFFPFLLLDLNANEDANAKLCPISQPILMNFIDETEDISTVPAGDAIVFHINLACKPAAFCNLNITMSGDLANGEIDFFPPSHPFSSP